MAYSGTFPSRCFPFVFLKHFLQDCRSGADHIHNLPDPGNESSTLSSKTEERGM
jgi:hypothetical protein